MYIRDADIGRLAPPLQLYSKRGCVAFTNVLTGWVIIQGCLAKTVLTRFRRFFTYAKDVADTTRLLW